MGIRITSEQNNVPSFSVSGFGSSRSINANPDISKFAGVITINEDNTYSGVVNFHNNTNCTVYVQETEIRPHSSKNISITQGSMIKIIIKGDYVSVGGVVI